jgi:hypothetical protein
MLSSHYRKLNFKGMLMLGVTRIPAERPGLLAALVGYE